MKTHTIKSQPFTLSCIVLFLVTGFAHGEVKDHRAIVPPDGHCLQGAAINPYGRFDRDLAGFQEAVGKKIAVLHWFSQALNKQGKPADWAAQQGAFLARCKSLGMIPCISYVFKSESGIFAGFDCYTRGEMDKQLQSMAKVFLDYQDPIILTLNHEMNGNWYPWSADRKFSSEKAALSGEADAAAPLPPDQVINGYIASWRYIHDYLRKAGCKNVAFGFIPSAGAYANKRKNLQPYTRYYPGDQYVDWLGFNVYNNTPPEAIEQLITELERLAPGKPLLIKEWGTHAQRAKEYIGGGDKYPGDGPWIHAIFGLVRRHPAIKAIIYYHWDRDHMITRPGGGETLKAYREEIKDSRFLTQIAPGATR